MSHGRIVWLALGGYVLTVALLLGLAVQVEGWDLVCGGAAFLLTLPWSLVSLLFTWSILHGAATEWLIPSYLLFAAFNGFLLGRLVARRRQKRARALLSRKSVVQQ